MKLITDTKQLDKAIASVKTRGAKLDRDIWITAVSAMQHHDTHGDVTKINALVDAMPKGARVNALREFITVFGKVTYNDKTKVFDHDKAGSFDLEGACEKSWTEFKPEPAYKPFDAEKAITALLKRVKDADPKKGDKCSEKQAEAIYALADELGVEHD